MIVEIRTYRTKPGRRADFVDLFEKRAGPTQVSLGMKLIGPLLDLENPDAFVWLRSFPSLEERDRLKEAFYEGALWKNELEVLVMPKVETPSSMTPLKVNWVPAISRVLSAPKVMLPLTLEVPVEVEIVPPLTVKASVVA